MPEAVYFRAADLVQLLLLLLIPLELLLASGARIKAEYDPRDTLANVAVSVGSIYFWGMFGWLYFGGVTFAYTHRLYDVPFACLVVRDRLRTRGLPLLLVASPEPPRRAGSGPRTSSITRASTSICRPICGRAGRREFSGLILLNVPLAFIGFHPGTVALAFTVNLLYQFWIHTETIDSMPRWFEWLLNTPSHHRVHHASNARYLDANYAGVFMIWDRLFGTFIPEDAAEPARYGIVKCLGTVNPIRIALHEYVGIARDQARPGLTLRQRLGYFFGPPGWRHDGRHVTTASLRAAEHARRERSLNAVAGSVGDRVTPAA